MNKIIPLLTCHLLLTFFSVAQNTRPNVLLILSDDQGYSDVGFNDNPIVQTPVLDAIADKAIVFDRFYANPVCSPTRAALMTGRYAYRTGVLETQDGLSILPPYELTIAEALKSSGYRTGLFGKWHLGDNAPARPVDQGFDRSLMHVAGMIGAPYSPLDAQSYFDPILIDDGVERRFKGYCADIFTNAAIDFVKKPSKKPFFVYLAQNTPHHPLTVGDHYAQPYRDAGLSEETARYYGMISNLDSNVGRLLTTIKQQGQLDKTIIIFLGDNGTSSLHKQTDLWTCGLRGRKTYVYENGVRVPMLIKLPKSAPNGRRLKTLASVEDLMPTILELCQVAPASHLDGISLVPLLKGEPFAKRSYFVQFHRGQKIDRYRNAAVIGQRWKLVQALGRGAEEFSPNNLRFELFDLENDFQEQQDLAQKHPEIVTQLKAEYDAWYDDVTSKSQEPVRTWIGSERQNPVMLTRQDWRGGGLFDGDLGYYELDVKKAGTYRISCRWSRLLKKTHQVTLKINDRVLKNQILYAESECRFEAVDLPKGPCRLEAWFEIDGKPMGFRFINIERTDEK
jgi:arylsulfatase A